MELETTLSRLRNVGLSGMEEEVIAITDEPKTSGYLCFPNPQAKALFSTEGVYGQGFDRNKVHARIKSIGEMLERLCIHNAGPAAFSCAYDVNAQRNHSLMDPALFCSYSDEQIHREAFLQDCRKQVLRWYPARDLTSEQDAYIPGQLVFLSKEFNDEFPLRGERITTGAACGIIGDNHALKSGFLEVVERDACISTYLTRRRACRIVDLPSRVARLVDYFRRYQLEPYLFDVTTDLGIPVVLAITLDHTGIGAAVNVGSKADFTYESAIERALLESIQCRRTGRLMRLECKPSADEIFSMEARFYYWHAPERIADVQFWCDNPPTVRYADLVHHETTFDNALHVMRLRGYHVFLADMTLPQLREQGFEVVKVVIPELHPLYLNERAKMLYSAHHGAILDNKTLPPHFLT